MHPLKIALVGCCASGKSTVARRLHDLGYNAYSVSQEHSVVSRLWDHNEPDVVVFLDVDLETIRDRKSNPDWPAWIYDIQVKRLASAREHARVAVQTDGMTVEEVVAEITDHLPDDSAIRQTDVPGGA